MRVRWQRGAILDLKQIAAYIREDNPRAAQRVYQIIRKHVSRLSDFPEMAREGRVEGTRELVIPKLPYIAVYRITETEVRILKIMHTSRRWPPSFPTEEES